MALLRSGSPSWKGVQRNVKGCATRRIGFELQIVFKLPNGLLAQCEGSIVVGRAGRQTGTMCIIRTTGKQYNVNIIMDGVRFEFQWENIKADHR